MRKLVFTCICLFLSLGTYAQAPADKQFTSGMNIFSMKIGFPNLYELSHKIGAQYTHTHSSGFGPFYISFEHALNDDISFGAYMAYATFSYNFYTTNSFPNGYQVRLDYSDRVNVFNMGLFACYHFNKFIHIPRMDTYGGIGVCVNTAHYSYGNYPPYNPDKSTTVPAPVIRIGARYFIGENIGMCGAIGYDRLTLGEIGLFVCY